MDQGVCFRPSYLYQGVDSPLAGKVAGDIDMVVFRENTEGEYAPMGGRLYPGTAHEVAVQAGVFTRHGTERIIRAAFEYARKRDKNRKVTSVTKSNAQAFSMVFWDEVFRDVAQGYPDIETESLLVDRACMDFIRWPESFDVVVASNLFADILTDIAAIITGSMGPVPLHVRTRPRGRLRYRWERCGQPYRHHSGLLPDAGPSGRAGGGCFPEPRRADLPRAGRSEDRRLGRRRHHEFRGRRGGAIGAAELGAAEYRGGAPGKP